MLQEWAAVLVILGSTMALAWGIGWAATRGECDG